MPARPETENPTLTEVLHALRVTEDDRELEALIRAIPYEAATSDAERALIVEAIIDAVARRLTVRWPSGCCGG